MSAEQAPSAINWIQLVFPAIGVSAVVGGVVSALVNYWMNRRASRKRDKIRMIEDKIRMYAFVLYYLNELRFKFQIISSRLGKPQEEDGYLYISDKNKDEWKPLVEAIDNKLREQPHLVSPQIHKKWVEVKSLFFDPKSKKAISELRKMLADEGNRIVKKYLKYIDQDVISGFSLDESVIGSTTQYNDNKDKDDRN
ncbi:MAG: hypothetical protein ACREAS_09180 [Nitrososphaera sp.]|jgi:hypothetical protein